MVHRHSSTKRTQSHKSRHADENIASIVSHVYALILLSEIVLTFLNFLVFQVGC